jgi:hypothetical protein
MSDKQARRHWLDPKEQATRLSGYAKRSDDERWLIALNEALAKTVLPPIEGGDRDPRDEALVYVVGLPRSGTTLASQVLVRHLEIGAINNVVARFWSRPSVGVRLSRILLGSTHGRHEITLESDLGVTRGLAEPHEFGYFWRRLLRLDEHANHRLPDEFRSRISTAELGRTLEDEIIQPFGRPVLIKNPICGLNARLLTAAHPRSLFVRMRRGHASVVRSILASRQRRYGSHATWWSLAPSTWPFDPPIDDPVEEIVRQVQDLERDLDAELTPTDVRAIDIDYEALCREPNAVVEKVRSAVEEMTGLAPTSIPVETAISPSEGPDVGAEALDRIQAALER